MQTALALVHHANQFLITEGYDNREGLDTVLGDRSAGHGLAHVLELHQRYRIPLNFHLSGTLLEAIVWHAPTFLDQVREMHQEGLIEFIGSCYGQNIMRFFDFEYNRRQINEELLLYQLHLGIDPHQMQVFWPPERVWETQRMAPALRDAALANNGYRYVLIDDRNLVGARDEFDDETSRWNADLFAMHEIEHGLGLNALPIATSLRRSIPPRERDDWQKVRHELEALLVHANGETKAEPLAIYADDMEKVSGIWGQERVEQYEQFLQWVAESNWLRSVKLADWARVNPPVSKRAVMTGTFAELSKEFEAGEGYEKWFYSKGWAPYREQFTWSQQRVKDCKQAGGDPSLIELAEKHLLASAWETAWHTPSTGVHGDANPQHNGQPSPWAKAIASHSRHAAVIGEAALWMKENDGLAYATRYDIDNDGEEEVILKNGSLFAVITPRWGGRLVSLFSIAQERGAMMVGNPSDDWNFLADLNRFMEVPRNHPGCFADVGHENDPFEVVDLSAAAGGASVKLMARNGLEKKITIKGENLAGHYRLPKRLAGLQVDFGLSPDYLSLLRAGSAALVSKTAERVRGCSTSGLAIMVELPEAGVEFVTPPQTSFGHGCLLRVESKAAEFDLRIAVGREPAESLSEAA